MLVVVGLSARQSPWRMKRKRRRKRKEEEENDGGGRMSWAKKADSSFAEPSCLGLRYGIVQAPSACF